MTETPHKVDTVPVIRVSYNANISEKAGLIFETYVPQDAHTAVINGIVDKLVEVQERQSARSKIETAELEIEQLTGMIERMSDDLVHMESNARAKHIEAYKGKRATPEFKLSASEQNNKGNAEQTLKGLIAKRDHALGELEKNRKLLG